MMCEEVARVVTAFQESRWRASFICGTYDMRRSGRAKVRFRVKLDDKTYGHKFSETIWPIKSSNSSSSSSSSGGGGGGGDDGGGVVVVVVVIVVIVERRCPGFIDRWLRVTPLYMYI
uniref:Uncharacterized protein n=1 Tax=Vespula pensylvanica TaxID=30213 RepID=A0A834N9M3_VESPE|nr:hypothetical protein H0235_015761 [Vespula pensylvanica]